MISLRLLFISIKIIIRTPLLPPPFHQTNHSLPLTLPLLQTTTNLNPNSLRPPLQPTHRPLHAPPFPLRCSQRQTRTERHRTSTLHVLVTPHSVTTRNHPLTSLLTTTDFDFSPILFVYRILLFDVWLFLCLFSLCCVLFCSLSCPVPPVLYALITTFFTCFHSNLCVVFSPPH